MYFSLLKLFHPKKWLVIYRKILYVFLSDMLIFYHISNDYRDYHANRMIYAFRLLDFMKSTRRNINLLSDYLNMNIPRVNMDGIIYNVDHEI